MPNGIHSQLIDHNRPPCQCTQLGHDIQSCLASAMNSWSQRTRRNESTRVLCAGCTDAEAAPRRLARSRHTRHIEVTRNCSPTLMSNCQDRSPTGQHRFGFSSRRHRLDKYDPVSSQVLAPDGRTTQLYQALFQLVGTFHFPAEQSASFVTNHQRATFLPTPSLRVVRRTPLLSSMRCVSTL